MTDQHASGERSAAVNVNYGTIVTGNNATINLNNVPVRVKASYGLRMGDPAFAGRESDLKTLLDLLDPVALDARRIPRTVIAGLGGIGKTELAVQVAHRMLNDGWFPGGVLFQDLQGYDEMRQYDETRQDAALGSFLGELGVPAEQIPPSSNEKLALYQTMLRKLADGDQRVLAIIDNVSSVRQAELLLPGDEKTGVIVTSRHALNISGAAILDLDVLEPEAAMALLETSLRIARGADTRVSRHRADAARVAELCGYLPLALKIVAAHLASPVGPSLAAVAHDLGDRPYRLDGLKSDGGVDDTPAGVRLVFNQSYRWLPDGQKRIFRLLSVGPGPDISTETAAILAELDEHAVRRALTALATAHLVEPGLAEDRWRMHDLVRLYAGELNNDLTGERPSGQPLNRMLHHYLGGFK